MRQQEDGYSFHQFDHKPKRAKWQMWVLFSAMALLMFVIFLFWNPNKGAVEPQTAEAWARKWVADWNAFPDSFLLMHCTQPVERLFHRTNVPLEQAQALAADALAQWSGAKSIAEGTLKVRFLRNGNPQVTFRLLLAQPNRASDSLVAGEFLTLRFNTAGKLFYLTKSRVGE
jgi:hypothetical protein